ncbi:MAG: hypothetical protein JSC188_000122 [Candidatus Tokpelaia sp. JSC188]|nr:MAG: hypothetical protein JSC188_000122 [Candidatus Tokpelaia sp. JSC188]
MISVPAAPKRNTNTVMVHLFSLLSDATSRHFHMLNINFAAKCLSFRNYIGAIFGSDTVSTAESLRKIVF